MYFLQSNTQEKNFKQGAVGAGRGTVCFGLKGGIGSASRILMFGGTEYTIGVLVQSNFGKNARSYRCRRTGWQTDMYENTKQCKRG